jgi:hypothetical protein
MSGLSKKTRPIEMLVAYTNGDSHGDWDTQMIDIPIETAEDDIERVACDTWWIQYKEDKRDYAVAGLMVYWIPEIEDEPTAYKVLKEIPAFTDHPVVPIGAVVYNAEPLSDIPEFLIIRTESEKVLVEYTPEGFYDARAPYMYFADPEYLEEING